MTALGETLRELARESGRLLGELGVDPSDRDWIRSHADTIASLAGEKRRGWFSRLMPRRPRLKPRGR